MSRRIASCMPRRIASAVLIVVLALQALALAPATFALGSGPHSSPAHCAEHMPDKQRDCPCCPDGALMLTGCMTLCATLGMSSTLPFLAAQTSPTAVTPFIALPIASQTYAPPDPPPIA